MDEPVLPAPVVPEVPASPPVQVTNITTQSQTLPFWLRAEFWITVMFVPLVYGIAFLVLYPPNGYSAEVRIMVVTAGFVTLVGTITAFWLASSFKSTSTSTDSSKTPIGSTMINNQTKE